MVDDEFGHDHHHYRERGIPVLTTKGLNKKPQAFEQGSFEPLKIYPSSKKTCGGVHKWGYPKTDGL